MIGLTQAADRYLQNEQRIANTTALNAEYSSNTVTNDINERASELGPVPRDNDSPIIASGCSGFESLTNLVNQNSFGNLTAALQVQRGGTNVLNDNPTDSPSNSDHCVTNPPLVSQHLNNTLPFLYAMTL